MMSDQTFAVRSIGAVWCSANGPVYASVMMADFDDIDITSAIGMFVRMPDGRTARVSRSVITDVAPCSPEEFPAETMHRTIRVGGIDHHMINAAITMAMTRWQIASLIGQSNIICPAEIYDRIFEKGKE